MSEASKKWIIRDTAGRITGPFTTEKILYMIGRGEFTGEEQVAFYPGGKWIAMSKEPRFYDKLLESLTDQEKHIPSSAAELSHQRDEPKTEINVSMKRQPQQPPPPEPESEEENTGTSEPTPTHTTVGDTATGSSAGSKSKSKSRSKSKNRSSRKKKKRRLPDIELFDTKGEYLKEIWKRGKIPIIACVAIVIVVYMFSGSDQSGSERIHLLQIQRNQPTEGADQVKARMHQGASEFLKDTYEAYLSAENNFVRVVESNSKDAEAMALLCMTYLELWPYSYQDSSDLRTMSNMVQMSSGVDPGGIQSSTCRSVDLIVRGRYAEAKNLIESMLESRVNQTTRPIVFYYLKGLMLDATGDFSTAISYLQSAESFWPDWIRPFVLEAQASIKLEKPSAAANILRRVLAANPHHAVAKIELGLLEYKNFNHIDRGEQLLNEGLGGSAPKDILSRGYFGLAEISLKAGNGSKALAYAQHAYSLNSSNSGAKNLIVRLGGVEKLRSTKIKGQQLVYEGDQFFREGDCQAAQAHYKAAFEEDPKNAVAAMKAATCLWRLSFSTEAIDWLTKAIRKDPKLIEAYVLMADYYTQRFNFLAASKILSAAFKINPKSSEVFRGYALVELRRGNPTGAISWGKKSLQIYENDVETQILMAQAYLAAGDYKLGYNYAAKAVEIDVNNRKAQTVYAEALMGLQGADVAVESLLKLIASYPLVIEYRLALGKIYEKDERYDEAEEVFRQIATIEDKPKEAYIELARVLKAQNRLNEALEYLLRAAVLDPADAEPIYQAGLIYLETRKGPEAMAQFQRVLKINNLFPLVHYNMGRAALMMGNAEQALEETRQEKSINPNLVEAYLLAADAHSANKQWSFCATEYQKAIKLRPQPAKNYVKLAACYRKTGNSDAAVDMLSHASAQEPGLADIYKEQGAIFEIKNEVQHAIEAYNQYFVLDPNAPDRMQIEARIQALQKGSVPPD
jgi:tetratricopeptide (TPR) repeat protein